MITADKRTVIAEFHYAHYFINRRKAQFEVQPTGTEMLGYVVLRFVFVGNKSQCKEQEKRAKSDDGWCVCGVTLVTWEKIPL